MRSRTPKSTAKGAVKGTATTPVLSPLTPAEEPSVSEPAPTIEAGDTATETTESPTEGEAEAEGAIATNGTSSSEGSATPPPDGKAETVSPPTPSEKSGPASQVVDLYDWGRTLITVTLSLLPGEEHPEGRPVALSIHSPGEVPLFRPPVRMNSLTLDQIQSLIAEYRDALPRRKEQKEAREQEKKAAQAAQTTNRGRKSDLPPPGQHLKGTKAKPTETFNERPISLFG